jgi:LPXTG-site transpeptidase (sortase) family protein
MNKLKKYILILIAVMAIAVSAHAVLAQENASVLYVPLIGLTAVPSPLALPEGEGDVTYNYAVKNFIKETILSDVKVTDDKCSPVKFVTGDDNGDSKLDYTETWRYACTTNLLQTTQSIATATGVANNITATHKAYATVVVGSNNPAPLVSIINITKIAYPLSLPAEGGEIIFSYKVSNPGAVPLSDVEVIDDKCQDMSGKLGDTNGNNLLDINEVWIYSCAANLTQTTTNTVVVSGFANGLKAISEATITVKVDAPITELKRNFSEEENSIFKITVWVILLGVLAALIVFFLLSQKRKPELVKKKPVSMLKVILIIIFLAVALGAGFYFLFLSSSPLLPELNKDASTETLIDTSFGWEFPIVKFPIVGPNNTQIAYSDIRDPGGIPQGLPIRLKIPVIGVDSAIEDALITSDGRMDVPVGSVNVAWFALGPHPGEIGSAVIGGHFGTSNGKPFVFYNLDKVKVDDKVYIIDDKGDSLAFIVRSIKLFDRDDDASTVFTSADGLAHLNLITCEGIWNQVNNTYPKRRVVFTDAIASETEAVKPISTAFSRSLSMGMRGADVAVLQSVLEEKGLLKMPVGVAKGYFGPLTRSAVANYQKSVGLVEDGVFNLSTKAKLVAEPSQVAIKIALPTTALTSFQSAQFSQIIRQYAKILFARPLDGAVTSLLLILILFIAFKIVRL